jgi:hypothetical protein
MLNVQTLYANEPQDVFAYTDTLWTVATIKCDACKSEIVTWQDCEEEEVRREASDE